jgi:hypothetical protein
VAAVVVVALIGRAVVLRSPRQAIATWRRDGEAVSAADERTVGDWRLQLEFAQRGSECSIRLRLTSLLASDWMPMVLLVTEDGRELQRLSPVGDFVSLPPQPPGRYALRLLGPGREELGAIPIVIEAERPQT